VVICLERCAGLHMAQLMPLPLSLLLHENPDWFTFLVPAHPGSPGQRVAKRVCVCVCVYCVVVVGGVVTVSETERWLACRRASMHP